MSGLLFYFVSASWGTDHARDRREDSGYHIHCPTKVLSIQATLEAADFPGQYRDKDNSFLKGIMNCHNLFLNAMADYSLQISYRLQMPDLL